MLTRVAAAAFACTFLIAVPASAGNTATGAAPVAAGAELIVPENPREAGARYGQAAGVALVCYGMRITAMPEQLKARYHDAALSAFNDEAENVLAAWKDVLSCKHAGGPNQCRLSHVFSCTAAMKEIGPKGTKLPGLVEEKPQGTSATAPPAAGGYGTQ